MFKLNLCLHFGFIHAANQSEKLAHKQLTLDAIEVKWLLGWVWWWFMATTETNYLYLFASLLGLQNVGCKSWKYGL